MVKSQERDAEKAFEAAVRDRLAGRKKYAALHRERILNRLEEYLFAI